jgi:hypothetical protein
MNEKGAGDGAGAGASVAEVLFDTGRAVGVVAPLPRAMVDAFDVVAETVAGPQAARMAALAITSAIRWIRTVGSFSPSEDARVTTASSFGLHD